MENINNINLGKIQPKKLTKKEKAEVEKQVNVQRNDAEVAGKGASKASRAYAAALIALGLMSGAGMTSCTDVENVSESKAETNNEEMLNLLKQLLNTQNSILAQLKANGEQNSAENQQMIKLLQEQNKILTNIMSGVTDIKTGIAQIQTLIEDANANDAEFLAKIDKIIAGQQTDSQKLDAILEENRKQTAFLANISPYIETIAQFDKETAETLKAFYEEYKAGNMSHSAFMEALLAAVEDNTAVSVEISGKIDDLTTKFENGQIEEGELLAQIAKLLESIDGNVAALLETVKGMAEDVAEMNDKMDKYQTGAIDVLNIIADNTGNLTANTNEIIKNQVLAFGQLVEISNKIDGIGVTLDEINQKEFTLTELEDMLGPLFKGIENKLEGLGNGDTITKEELKEILNEYKTDLTKTNALIETLTNVVQNLDLKGMGSEKLAEIANILNEIKNGNEAGRAEVNASLAEALAKLANIEGGVDALAGILKNFNNDFNDAMGLAGDKFGDFIDEFRVFAAGNNGNLQALQNIGEDVKEYLVQAQTTRIEQLGVLEAILAKEAKPVEGDKFELDYDKLKEMMPDYTEILEEISEKLGNVITSSDLENFFIRTQPDLTKTNALIETLTNVVQNKNFAGGSGSADMTKVENLLGNILDAINAKQAPTPEQIDEAIKLLNKIVGNTETPASRMVSSRATEEYVNLASASDMATSFQITPEMIANAYKQYNA